MEGEVEGEGEMLLSFLLLSSLPAGETAGDAVNVWFLTNSCIILVCVCLCVREIERVTFNSSSREGSSPAV